jgi:hypothetical protein
MDFVTDSFRVTSDVRNPYLSPCFVHSILMNAAPAFYAQLWCAVTFDGGLQNRNPQPR